MLIVAAIVSTTLGIIENDLAHGLQDGAGILLAIMIIIIANVCTNYSKEKKFQESM